MNDITPEHIIDFWFSERVKPLHFVKDESFDQEISNNFNSAYEKALAGQLDDWMQTAEGSLALVIILDQFPRNMFRDKPEAFATDEKARAVAKNAIDHGYDLNLTDEQRSFLYMPFMHSENLQEQDFSVELYRKLGREYNLKYAIDHRDIIVRFNRFPHRNIILERDSTEDEAEFLKSPGSSF